jgi:hypothetical protein
MQCNQQAKRRLQTGKQLAGREWGKYRVYRKIAVGYLEIVVYTELGKVWISRNKMDVSAVGINSFSMTKGSRNVKTQDKDNSYFLCHYKIAMAGVPSQTVNQKYYIEL